MAQVLDSILRYSVSNLKKFEWANCYRIARSLSMTVSNIESAWSGAGLIPFMPQKVIRRLKGQISDAETASQLISTADVTSSLASPYSNPFDQVSATPS